MLVHSGRTRPKGNSGPGYPTAESVFRTAPKRRKPIAGTVAADLPPRLRVTSLFHAERGGAAAPVPASRLKIFNDEGYGHLACPACRPCPAAAFRSLPARTPASRLLRVPAAAPALAVPPVTYPGRRQTTSDPHRCVSFRKERCRSTRGGGTRPPPAPPASAAPPVIRNQTGSQAPNRRDGTTRRR